jgi:hypothetical protein
MHSHLAKPFIALVLALAIPLALPLTAWADAAKLDSYLPQGCYHAGEYQQHKTLAGMDKPLITDGSFAFNCNQGLIWHTQSPIIETIIYKAQGDHVIMRADGSTQALDSRAQRALGKILNNLIGGNSDYLQQTFSITEKSNSIEEGNSAGKESGIGKENNIGKESSLELIPKNKQMQKFLRSLSITPQTDSVKITLQLAEQETIAIRIFARHSFANLEQAQCEQLPKLSPQACKILFKGMH